VRFWLTVGLIPKSAKGLAAAGYRSLTDLAGATQENLLAISGVGPAALAMLEAALGRPIPCTRKRRILPPDVRPWPDLVWRKRGLPASAAITFDIEGMTLERLRSISREELLALPGVGRETVKACELMIGAPISSRKIDPVEAFWREQGIFPLPARALWQAGIASLADLRPLCRDDLLAVPGVSEVTLARLEALLGYTVPSRADYWLRRGLPLGFANVLAREKIGSLADLAALSREQFLSFRGVGRAALWRCERLLGHKLPSRPHDRP
jgi:DNA repair protein RadC